MSLQLISDDGFTKVYTSNYSKTDTAVLRVTLSFWSRVRLLFGWDLLVKITVNPFSMEIGNVIK